MAVRKPEPFPRIERVPGVCGGEPVVKGTRIPVSCIVTEYQERQDIDWILRGYPRLDRADVEEALAFYELNRDEIDQIIEENERIAYSSDPD